MLESSRPPTLCHDTLLSLYSSLGGTLLSEVTLLLLNEPCIGIFYAWMLCRNKSMLTHQSPFCFTCLLWMLSRVKPSFSPLQTFWTSYSTAFFATVLCSSHRKAGCIAANRSSMDSDRQPNFNLDELLRLSGTPSAECRMGAEWSLLPFDYHEDELMYMWHMY